MQSEISFNAPLLPQGVNLFTPLKNNNFCGYSSNKYKNFSSSSGNLLGRMKEYSNQNNNNNNNNMISSLFLRSNSRPKRKLFEEFNKSTMCKNNANESNTNHTSANNLNNNQQNSNNNNNANYNISNNNTFSFFSQSNITEKDKEKENEKNIDKKNDIITNDNNIIMDNNITHNNIFFTDYGLGYKCNCQKTQCNKYYCQCFREKRYCFNCNCVGCCNQKPEHCSSNKHQMEEENKDKKNNISIACTCTKSGCNKNYCECFKNKVKCNSLCRCRNCENCEEGKFEKIDKKISPTNNNYECCLANSVYIVRNKIVLEDINQRRKQIETIRKKIKLMINESFLDSFSYDEKEKIGHKRKREDEKEMDIDNSMSNKKSKSNKSENLTYEANNSKNKEEGDDDVNSGELFDKKGKLILSNFQL